MAIKVDMSGSGEIGEIQPGWSVSESATPVTIGETGSGTGSVSLAAGKKPTSLLVVNNDIITEDDQLGSISGVVNTVNDQGASVSLTHSTLLSDFNIEKNIPELSAGSPFTALDLCTQLVGQNRLRSDLRGWFGSLAGHSVLFDASGGRVFGDTYYATYEFYNNSTGKFEKQIVSSATNSVFADDFEYLPNGILYANGVDGESFTPDPAVENTFHVAFKIPNINFPTVWSFRGLPSSSGSDLGFTASVSIYNTGGFKFLNVMFDYWSGGLRTIEEQTVEIPASSSDEFYVFIKYAYEPSDSGVNNFILSASVQPSGDIDTLTGYTTASSSIALFTRPTWYEKWNISGYVRSVWSYSEILNIEEPVRGDLLRTNWMENSSFESSNLSAYTIYCSNVDGEFVEKTVTRDSNKKWIGNNSLKITPSAPAYAITIESAKYIPVSGSSRYAISNYFLKNSSLQNLDLYNFIDYYDSNKNYISTGGFRREFISGTVSHLTWSRITATSISPSNAAYAIPKIRVTNFNTENANITFYIDALQFEMVESSFDALPTSYFDGSFTLLGRDYDFEIIQEIEISREYELVAITSPDIPFRYDSEINISKESTNVLGGPAIGFNGNMWEYLQNACAAYNQEIALVDNLITLRDVGSNEIDLTNVVASPAITPSSTFSGKAVDIVYTNAKKVSDAEVYDAYDDDNRIITVKSKEVVQLTVAANAYVSSVLPPLRKFSLPNADGYYIVSDNTGTPVGGTSANTAWEDYGGKVEVSINLDVPGSIDIKVTGPFQEIPAYPGPYKLAYSDGSNDYAAFSVTGRGITNDSETLSLQTAADRTKSKQDVAKTINNPFIDTLEMAYDRGVWASAEAAGPRVALSGNIPASSIEGFGLVAGSLIRYNDSQYRVTDATIGNLGVSFNAVRYVTVEEFDALWDGKTVSYHDGVWYGFDSQDQTIIPFYGLNIVDGYIGFDTDNNPYLKVTGTGEGEAELLFEYDLSKTNLVTNPSFETGTSGWVATNDCTISQSTLQKYSGNNSLLIQRTGTFNRDAARFIVTGLTPGIVYTASLWAYITGYAGTYNADGILIMGRGGVGGFSTARYSNTKINQWQRLSGKAIASNTGTIEIYAYAMTGFDVFIDSVQLNFGENLTEYFDGSTVDTEEITYEWSGTPHSSTSLKYTKTPYYKLLDGSNSPTLLELDVDFTPYYV